ncbi:MAG: hypothetical protein M1837_004449 [Sclerophora amabilis]|nr:MAG: hypothetical protein M1837_004449 [Sclerophora amabilis]
MAEKQDTFHGGEKEDRAGGHPDLPALADLGIQSFKAAEVDDTSSGPFGCLSAVPSRGLLEQQISHPQSPSLCLETAASEQPCGLVCDAEQILQDVLIETNVVSTFQPAERSSPVSHENESLLQQKQIHPQDSCEADDNDGGESPKLEDHSDSSGEHHVDISQDQVQLINVNSYALVVREYQNGVFRRLRGTRGSRQRVQGVAMNPISLKSAIRQGTMRGPPATVTDKIDGNIQARSSSGLQSGNHVLEQSPQRSALKKTSLLDSHESSLPTRLRYSSTTTEVEHTFVPPAKPEELTPRKRKAVRFESDIGGGLEKQEDYRSNSAHPDSSFPDQVTPPKRKAVRLGSDMAFANNIKDEHEDYRSTSAISDSSFPDEVTLRKPKAVRVGADMTSSVNVNEKHQDYRIISANPESSVPIEMTSRKWEAVHVDSEPETVTSNYHKHDGYRSTSTNPHSTVSMPETPGPERAGITAFNIFRALGVKDLKGELGYLQWVARGHKKFGSWSATKRKVWEKDYSSEETRREIRNNLQRGFVFILQKMPPRECRFGTSRCAYNDCSAKGKRTPEGTFRLSLEPRSNLEMNAVPDKSLKRSRGPGQGINESTWYCLTCLEALWNGDDPPASYEKQKSQVTDAAAEEPTSSFTNRLGEHLSSSLATENINKSGMPNRFVDAQLEPHRREEERNVLLGVESTLEHEQGTKYQRTGAKRIARNGREPSSLVVKLKCGRTIAEKIKIACNKGEPESLIVRLRYGRRIEGRINRLLKESNEPAELVSAAEEGVKASESDQNGNLKGANDRATRPPVKRSERLNNNREYSKGLGRSNDTRREMSTESSRASRSPSKMDISVTPRAGLYRATKTDRHEGAFPKPKNVSASRKPTLKPFQRLYSSILPETRDHHTGYFTLSSPQQAALAKWKDSIMRREMLENENNVTLLAANNLLLNYDTSNGDTYLGNLDTASDGPVRGFMEMGGALVELSSAEVRDRDLSTVMQMLDERVQVELDKEGFVPSQAPKAPAHVRPALQRGVDTPERSATHGTVRVGSSAMSASSSSDEYTSGSDDNEDMGEAKALY